MKIDYILKQFFLKKYSQQQIVHQNNQPIYFYHYIYLLMNRCFQFYLINLIPLFHYPNDV